MKSIRESTYLRIDKLQAIEIRRYVNA